MLAKAKNRTVLLRTPRLMRAAAALMLFLLFCGFALAASEPQPKLQVKVGLSESKGAGVSIRFGFIPAEPNSRALPVLRTLRVTGDIGTLDLRGIPTCKPTTRSPWNSSNCTTPPIGKGRGSAYQSTTAEGDLTLKLDGSALIYSGGQHGKVAKLYAWVSFPAAGPRSVGKSIVIPITSRYKGRGRSELLARFPQPQGNLFSVAQLELSILKTVHVDGRSIPVTSVPCPVRPTAKARAEATFYGPSGPVGATASPSCAR